MFTATATVKNVSVTDGEQMTFYDGPTLIGTSVTKGGIATVTVSSLAVKTHTIKAVYAGDNQIEPSQGSVMQVVEKYPTTTTLATRPNPTQFGQAVTLTATVVPGAPVAPAGIVSFTWASGLRTFTIGSARLNSSGLATLTKSDLNADPYPLVATYNGDANNQSSVSPVVNQTVLQTTSAATITSSLNPSMVGQAVTFTAKITSPTVIPKGPVTFKAGTTVLGTVQLSGGKASYTTTALLAGSTVIKVTYNGDSNIKGSSSSVTQIVHP